MSGFTDRYVAKLRAENEELLAEIQQLRAALTPPCGLPAKWRLWPQQETIFRTLLARDVVSRDALMLAIAHDRDGEMCSSDQLNTLMSKMRKRLADHGVAISARRHVGYSLHDRQVWRQRLLSEAA